jgi:hypothetical protein
MWETLAFGITFSRSTYMTRTTFGLAGAALIAAIVLPTTASAQDSASARTKPAAPTEASAPVALTGVTIVRIDTVKSGGAASLNAVLASGSDSINVMLAPVEFLTSKSITLAAGDVIDVSGARVMVGGRPALVATEIKKGSTSVMLRDKATGAPAWGAGGPTRNP